MMDDNLSLLKEYVDASADWKSRAAVLESRGISPNYPQSKRDKGFRDRFLRAEAALVAAIRKEQSS